jgi:hypothetical protein
MLKAVTKPAPVGLAPGEDRHRSVISVDALGRLDVGRCAAINMRAISGTIAEGGAGRDSSHGTDRSSPGRAGSDRAGQACSRAGTRWVGSPAQPRSPAGARRRASGRGRCVTCRDHRRPHSRRRWPGSAPAGSGRAGARCASDRADQGSRQQAARQCTSAVPRCQKLHAPVR